MEKGGGDCDRDGYPPPSLLLLFSLEESKGFLVHPPSSSLPQKQSK